MYLRAVFLEFFISAILIPGFPFISMLLTFSATNFKDSGASQFCYPARWLPRGQSCKYRLTDAVALVL
jgi:hypothetical protein